MKLRKTIARLLLAFLLVSVGYAIGREVHGTAYEDETAEIMVYYMHGAPCVTCTRINKTAEALVHGEFGAEVEAGRMKYVSLNYLEPRNERLARRYNVGRNMIIVARFRDGWQVQQMRLDRVMEFAHEKENLEDYIRQAVRVVLADGDAE